MPISERKFKVELSRREDADQPVEWFRIRISPLEDSRDSYDSAKALIRVNVGPSSDYEEFSGFFGFQSDGKGPPAFEYLREYLQAQPGISTPPNDLPFFTMLYDMSQYRRLVDIVGLETAREILLTMNDIVAGTELETKSSWVSKAVQTDIFLKAFLLTSDSYYAYKNAGPLLWGVESEHFRTEPTNITIRFHLAGRPHPDQLRFHFKPDAALPKRTAVVIGKNGLGKSQALGKIASAALSGSPDLHGQEPGSRIEINRVLAFAPSDQNSPFPTGRRKHSRTWYRRFSMSQSGRSRYGSGASDLVVQLARSEESIAGSTRWQIFLEAITAIEDWDQIALPVRPGLGKPLYLKEFDRNVGHRLAANGVAVNSRRNPVRLIQGRSYPLSSGELSFLRFAAQACLHIENGSLLLLDEPETHLHPHFISRFVLLLNSILQLTGSLAIIATHSVFFVREVFEDQVIVLKRSETGQLKAMVPGLNTFGANVGAVSYFVFDEDEPSPLANKVKRQLLDMYQTWEDLDKDCGDQLSLTLLGELREAFDERSRPVPDDA